MAKEVKKFGNLSLEIDRIKGTPAISIFVEEEYPIRFDSFVALFVHLNGLGAQFYDETSEEMYVLTGRASPLAI